MIKKDQENYVNNFLCIVSTVKEENNIQINKRGFQIEFANTITAKKIYIILFPEQISIIHWIVWGAPNLTVIVKRNGINDPSLNPGEHCLRFTSC